MREIRTRRHTISASVSEDGSIALAVFTNARRTKLLGLGSLVDIAEVDVIILRSICWSRIEKLCTDDGRFKLLLLKLTVLDEGRHYRIKRRHVVLYESQPRNHRALERPRFETNTHTPWSASRSLLVSNEHCREP